MKKLHQILTPTEFCELDFKTNSLNHLVHSLIHSSVSCRSRVHRGEDTVADRLAETNPEAAEGSTDASTGESPDLVEKGCGQVASAKLSTGIPGWPGCLEDQIRWALGTVQAD